MTEATHERGRRNGWRIAGGLIALALGVAVGSCGGVHRFALRPPLLRDSDDRPFAPALPEDAESELANGADALLLRPLAHALLFERGFEALDVNSLDEVPDSTWFTNRVVSPADVARGPCPDDVGPVAPFVVLRSKAGGDTPGFVAEDATGQRWVLKFDPAVPTQHEITTAADAIVARLYWAIGFNAPCNEVIYVRPDELRVDPERSTEQGSFGSRRPLTRARLDAVLTRATPGPGGTVRLGASRFIDGRPAGTWRDEGVRADDPNDVIPHEDRRELRGERFLAAWVAHWDSRGPNTYDAFVEAPGGEGGYVLHYFLDFGDCLGTRPVRTRWNEPRTSHLGIGNAPNAAADALGFGFIRRPWDEMRPDPRFPNLGLFGSRYFVPMDFAAQTPVVRWDRAQPADLAWMARRMARLGRDHVAAAVAVGRLSTPGEPARMLEILMERRAIILRESFDRVSPLADLATTAPRRLCASDLGVRTGLSEADDVSYALEVRIGDELRPSPGARVAERDGDRVCVELPASFAPDGARDDAAERYAILTITRAEGSRRTQLRAHFYDLGPARGYVLVGVERP